jgi:hemin uptake protein HemP
MNGGSPKVINSDTPDTVPGDQSGTTLIERSIPLTDNRIQSRDLFVSSREIIIAHGEKPTVCG